MRFNALSRTIENALQKEGIPCRILGGHKFFERLEVKDVLAYLQLLDNPAFVPALLRVINVPGRGIGEKVGLSTNIGSRYSYLTELLLDAGRHTATRRKGTKVSFGAPRGDFRHADT